MEKPNIHEEVDPRRDIIETEVNIYRSLEFSLILKDRSYENYINPSMVKWLSILCMLKSDPYPTMEGHWVTESVKVAFTHSKYLEEIWCDIIPMSCDNLCLEYNWFNKHKIPISENGTSMSWIKVGIISFQLCLRLTFLISHKSVIPMCKYLPYLWNLVENSIKNGSS